MKKIFFLIAFSMAFTTLLAQSGEGYDPSNPGDPNPCYRLYLEASPATGGSVNNGSTQLLAGQTHYCSASPNFGYDFKHWMMGDSVVSTKRNFYFVMPAENVTLIAYFEWNDDYNPSNPGDPSIDGYAHDVNVYASPSSGGYFNKNYFRMIEGTTTQIYAYPNNNFRFSAWKYNGEIISTSNPLSITMGDTDLAYTATFVYDPANPGNPMANNFNPATGELIMDDFNPGSLNSAIQQVLKNYSYSEVQSIIVEGSLNSNDYGFYYRMTNCSMIDLARTAGYNQIPSYAFEDMLALTKVILPASVTKINNYAFYGCDFLSELVCYATEPPVLGNYVFDSSIEGLVVRVPSTAVAYYEQAAIWENFTILPLDEETGSLTVNLPEDAADGRYKNMIIELKNITNGHAYRYIITDKTSYTFNNLISNSIYNVIVKNTNGAVLGCIYDVMITEEEEQSVTFESLLQPQNVTVVVTTPDGEDVTSKSTVTWYDNNGKYLTQGSVIKGIIENTKLKCRIDLSQDLAMQYVLPTELEYIVKPSDNTIYVGLNPFEEITLSGVVRDNSYNTPINNATVTISQTLNGKYSKSIVANTNNNGEFSATVYKIACKVVAVANDYLSNTITINDIENTEALNNILLKSLTGVKINTLFTYTNSVVDGETAETQNYYSDYANISYSVYHKTTQHEVENINVQYPYIVLMGNIKPGDEVSVTASSRNNMFMDVTVDCVVDEDNLATVTFPIVELGKIQSDYNYSESSNVIGILYDANGQFLTKSNYSNKSLTFSNIVDGNYSLVSMKNTNFFNSILNLSELSEAGLYEGRHFIKNDVTVESGKISLVSINEIYDFDESEFYYTGDETSFTVNKQSVTVGNYVTLRAKVDFKPEFANNISDVKLIFDLPSSCDFVDNSVMAGNTISSYTLGENHVEVELAYTNDLVRFCVVPMEGGSCNPSAFVQFKLNGEEIRQPIGNAGFEAKSLEINVPSVTASKEIAVSGVCKGNSLVEIYDNDVLIATVNSLAHGAWSTKCELNNAYNLSTHNIYAKVVLGEMILQSETKEVVYDINAIQVSKVTMYYNNYELIYDFINPNNKSNYWVYNGNINYTYTIEFTDNSPEKVMNVILYVHTLSGKIFPYEAEYNEEKDLWIVNCELRGEYPVNVSVDFDMITQVLWDREYFDAKYNNIENMKLYYSGIVDSINSLNEASLEIQNNIIEDSIFYTGIYDDINDNIGNLQYVDSLLLLYLNHNSDTVYDDDIFDVHIPDDIDMVYLDSVLNDCDIILNDSVAVDYDYIDSLLYNIDILLNNLEYDFETSLNMSIRDTITLDTDEGKYRMYSTSIDKLDISSFNISDTISLPMTDGSNVTVLMSEVGDFMIVDSINNSAWIYNVIDTTTIRGNVLRGDFISAMNTAKEDISNLINSMVSFIVRICKDLEESKNDLITEQSVLKSEKQSLSKTIYYKKSRIYRLERYINGLSKYITIGGEQFPSAEYQLCIIKRDELRRELRSELKSVQTLEYKINKLNVTINGIGAKIVGITTALGKAANLYQLVDSLRCTITYIYEAISDFQKWHSLINEILPCEKDFANAEKLKSLCESNWDDIAWKEGYYPAMGISGVATIINAYMFSPAGQSVGFLMGFFTDVITSFIQNTADALFTQAKQTSSQLYPQRYSEYLNLKCNEDKPKPKPGPGQHKPNQPDDEVSIDPSGFVYEGVSSNRVEGVMASCYYKEFVEDMYGDIIENVVLWDAEAYAQENPLFTDENGMYRWDVPQGLWQVKFEKEGYETTYSDWLPVPPPQLEVNIPIVQYSQPNVIFACAYQNAIEVHFDKYMMPSFLTTDNITVTVNGENVAGSIEFLDEEACYEGMNEKYVSKVRFNADEPFQAEEVTLTVESSVRSYANIRMQDDFTQTFTVEVEIQKIVCPPSLQLTYNEETTIEVSVIPAVASKGKTLNIVSQTPLILSVNTSSVVINEEGKAQITLKGELPGSASLSFNVEGYDINAQTSVKVEQKKIYDSNQTMTLNEGWNWVSTYLDIDGNDGLNRIQKALGGNAQQIKSQLSFSSYNDGNWYGLMESASTEEMYMIMMLEEAQMSLNGNLVDPAEHPITLQNNWTWFGYILNEDMSLEDGLANFTPNSGDYVKSQLGFNTYYNGSWYGETELSFEVGKGYMYRNTSGAAKTLVYPSNNSKGRYVGSTSVEKHWHVDVNKYPTNMSIIAVVNVDDEEMTDYEIGAFSDGECRGSARPVYVDALNRYLLFLTVHGEGNEEITFRYYDVVADEEYDYVANEMIYYSADATIGTMPEPYALNFGTTNVNDHTYCSFEVYPNPVDKNNEIHLGTICEKVEVYNSIGVKVAEYSDVNTIDGIEVPGVYIINAIGKNSVKYCRLIVK